MLYIYWFRKVLRAGRTNTNLLDHQGECAMVLRYSATHPWDYSTGVQKDLNPYSLPDISDFRIPEFKNYLINLNNSDSWEFWNVKGIPSNAAIALLGILCNFA